MLALSRFIPKSSGAVHIRALEYVARSRALSCITVVGVASARYATVATFTLFSATVARDSGLVGVVVIISSHPRSTLDGILGGPSFVTPRIGHYPISTRLRAHLQPSASIHDTNPASSA